MTVSSSNFWAYLASSLTCCRLTPAPKPAHEEGSWRAVGCLHHVQAPLFQTHGFTDSLPDCVMRGGAHPAVWKENVDGMPRYLSTVSSCCCIYVTTHLHWNLKLLSTSCWWSSSCTPVPFIFADSHRHTDDEFALTRLVESSMQSLLLEFLIFHCPWFSRICLKSNWRYPINLTMC